MMTVETLLAKADRRLAVDGIIPELRDKVRQVIAELQPQGIYICVAQGYRSIAEQNALYAQGRTTPGDIVTNARGGQSNHNFGVAIDLCLYTDDGTDVIWKTEGPFQKVIAEMKARGFKWGGDWKSFKDYPHFELYNVVGGEKIKPYNGDASTVVTPASTDTDEPAEPVTPPTPQGTKKGYCIGTATVTADVLNVRKGPGIEYGVSTKLVEGNVRKVFREVDGWYWLGGENWISANYAEFFANIKTVTASKLNIRKGPSTQYEIVDQLTKGEKLVVLAEQRGFYAIEDDQWVSTQYME